MSRNIILNVNFIFIIDECKFLIYLFFIEMIYMNDFLILCILWIDLFDFGCFVFVCDFFFCLKE